MTQEAAQQAPGGSKVHRRKARPYEARWWALQLIRAYQKLLSPLLGKNCRYLPTCSRYGYEAIEQHGLIKGGWLAVRRVGRCNPLAGHGYDPVPSPKART